MGKVIFVLLDACQYEAATEELGYLEHLVDYQQGAKYKVRGELPSLSRPMYETLLTGLPVHVHGIVSNATVRRSRCESVFSLCREHGKGTAAAAYYWVSELYNEAPFDRARHRIQLSSPGLIQNGIFYFEDMYPDSHLLMDGEFLRRQFAPDFLMLHSMAVDEWGHLQGSQSAKYRGSIAAAGELLSTLLPAWREAGYAVVITADHGMNALGMHGGTTDEQRDTPLYLFGGPATPGRHTGRYISQLNVAPLLCRLLGVPPAPGMLAASEIAGL